jgi:cytochrome b561
MVRLYNGISNKKSQPRFSQWIYSFIGIYLFISFSTGLIAQYQAAPENSEIPIVDGSITANEYQFTANFANSNYKLHWQVDNDVINIAIEAKTTGWVAIGFGTKSMTNADMIIGWVTESSNAIVIDTYSDGSQRGHPEDTSTGGFDDILAFAGTEKNGRTIIEFSRMLSTDDTKDNDIPKSGTINIATGDSSEDEDILLWPVHATLMVLGFTLMLIGIIIAKALKKKSWWYKTHKGLNTIGALLAILGLIIGFYMVSEANSEHFSIPHHFLGVITILLLISNLSLGYGQAKAASSSQAKLRMVHRFIGRIVMILMVLNIVSGLSLVGLI